MSLLGPRQVGKTTLVQVIAEAGNAIYLDLEDYRDQAKLDDASGYFAMHEKKLVILDEIQRRLDIFHVLCSEIDHGRRRGLRTRRILFLGSMSLDVQRQSSETIAGRFHISKWVP